MCVTGEVRLANEGMSYISKRNIMILDMKYKPVHQFVRVAGIEKGKKVLKKKKFCSKKEEFLIYNRVLNVYFY